jgi:hypothetical protein
MKSPGALAASGALEKDQLDSTVISTPIASLHQLQALLIVVARATHCRFTTRTFNGTRVIVASTQRSFLGAQRLSDLRRRSNRVPGVTDCDANVSSKFATATIREGTNHAAYL